MLRAGAGRARPPAPRSGARRHDHTRRSSAGFAAFVQGRSLCIRLDGTLDNTMAEGVAEQIVKDRENVRLRLECSTLETIDGAAARARAHALLRWSQRRPDRSVDILNLRLDLQQQVAWHPFRTFLDPDELVFIDPDRDTAWTVAPGRH